MEGSRKVICKYSLNVPAKSSANFPIEGSRNVLYECSLNVPAEGSLNIPFERSTRTFKEHCFRTFKKPGQFSLNDPYVPWERSGKVLCYGGTCRSDLRNRSTEKSFLWLYISIYVRTSQIEKKIVINSFKW